MIRILVLWLVAACALPAQEIVSKMIVLKHVRAREVAPVLDAYAGNTVRKSFDANGYVIALVGPKAAIDQIEAAVKELDVPEQKRREKNIEMLFYMIVASHEAGGKPLPDDLAPVVKQLKSVFGYTSYQLLETAVIRTREGKPGGSMGVLPYPSGEGNRGFPSNYNIRFNNVQAGEGISIDSLRFTAKVATPTGGGQWQFVDTYLESNLDLKPGQKVVVGKTGIDSSANTLFLVVSARIAE